MDIFSLIDLLKYIMIGLAVLGVIVIIVGLSKSDTETIKRGAYLIVIAIVAYICSYFLVRKAEQRMNEFIPEYYEEQYNSIQ